MWIGATACTVGFPDVATASPRRTVHALSPNNWMIAPAALAATVTGSSPPLSRWVRSSRICASPRCSAVWRRVSSRVTTHPISAAVNRNAPRATRSSSRSIEKFPLGCVKQ